MTDRAQEWPIHEVARIAGTTSRTLRHYADVGLLTPSRVGANGYRYYDDEALVRLQRILLLRNLGLGLATIAEVMSRQTDVASALESHIMWLRQEHDRIDRQIASVEHTLGALSRGEELVMPTMFDGFDHTAHREEVERRWGAAAYQRSTAWWDAMSAEEKTQWKARVEDLNQAWVGLAASGADPGAADAQALAQRHVAWLSSIPGTPAAEGDRSATRQYVLGLAEMYATDPRFAANYGGHDGATFVRRALERFVSDHL